MSASTTISATRAKALLHGGGELAFLDVREAGQYGDGHALLATSVPYSVLERRVAALVPRRDVAVLLVDAGDGVAERAAQRLGAIGYTDLRVVEGGMPAWAGAGLGVFKGVNVPSKVFGELVEHAAGTPSIDPLELAALQAGGAPLVVLDGRSPEEYRRMTIPGSVSCPNAELALRFDALAPDPAATVVVNCAGRTRSIIGAQSLIDLGVPQRVVALRNGTMGWRLADLALDHGATRSFPVDLRGAERERALTRARALAARDGLSFVDAATLETWHADGSRSLYVLDVRTEAEFAAGHAPGALHAPGGQLVQATDQWVGVRGARIVLVDDLQARAIITAHWLRGMGHEVHVLAEDDARRACAEPPRAADAGGAVPGASLPALAPAAVREALAGGALRCLDLRPSAAHRAAHPAGADWSIRPRLATPGAGGQVLLLADEADVAELAAVDLAEGGAQVVGTLAGGPDDWRAGGLDVVATPDRPADAERIDFLFFVHDRHGGNLDAAREYLRWEIGLLEQLDVEERALFRVGAH